MKFFQKNIKAITLVELIVAMTITAILMVIISFFITESVKELTDNDLRVNSVEQSFDFKDTMQRYIRAGYSNPVVFTWITDPAYTWALNNNNVLYLEDLNWKKWLLIWIVNLDNNLIQRNYLYWENYLWYRELSSTEIQEINSNSWVIYSKEFHNDNIFKYLRMKDFSVDLYNWWESINIKYKIINLFNESLYWENFEDFYIDSYYIDEYNLVF